MRDVGELLAGLGAFIVNAAIFVVIMGAGMGVVKEHCVDVDQARAGVRDLDSGWTYIVWPPLVFANLDPSGGCVRNSPLRELLASVGIWKLPSAEAQVEKHIGEQINASDGDGTGASPADENPSESGESSSDSPETVAREYLQAFAALDGVGMCERLAPESKRLLQKEVLKRTGRDDLSCPQIMVGLTQNLDKKLRERIGRVRIEDVQVRGDRAVVRAAGADQRLRKVDGEWLLLAELPR